MNYYQILLLALVFFSVYFILNLRFKISRLIGVILSQSLRSNSSLKHKRTKVGSQSGMLYFAAFFIGIFTAFFLSMALFSIDGWFTNYNLAKISTKWQPIEATVVKKSRTPRGRRYESSNTLSGNDDNIWYSFIYNNMEYKGIDLSFSTGHASDEKNNISDLLLSAPAVGEKTTIYFDEKTGKSVMFPGRQYTNYSGLLFVFPFLIIGIVMSFFSGFLIMLGLSLKY